VPQAPKASPPVPDADLASAGAARCRTPSPGGGLLRVGSPRSMSQPSLSGGPPSNATTQRAQPSRITTSAPQTPQRGRPESPGAIDAQPFAADAASRAPGCKGQSPRPASQNVRNRTPPVGSGGRSARSARTGVSPRPTTSPRWVSASTSAVFVEELTGRIRRLEGELERAVAAVHKRRGGPTPQASGDLQTHPPEELVDELIADMDETRKATQTDAPLQSRGASEFDAQSTAFLGLGYLPDGDQGHSTPELVPEPLDLARKSTASSSSTTAGTRSSCAARVAAQAVSQAAEAFSTAPRNPSQVVAMCQLMQMEWRELVAVIQDACDRCDVKAKRADNSDDSSPRQMVSSLASAYLSLAAQMPEKEDQFDAAVQTDASCGANSAARHERSACSDLSLLSVSISAADAGSPDGTARDEDASARGIGHDVSDCNYFGEAATALRSILASSTSTNGSLPSSRRPEGNAFLSIPAAARFDLLDLVVAVKRAEPLLLEATAPDASAKDMEGLALARATAQTPQQGVAAVKVRSSSRPPASIPQQAKAAGSSSASSLADSRSSTQRLRVSWAEDAVKQEEEIRAKPAADRAFAPAPPASRLSKLIKTKEWEVLELEASNLADTSSEATTAAQNNLAVAREELRLLREYAGVSTTTV